MRKRWFALVLLLPLAGLAAPAPIKSMDDQIAAYKAAGEPIEPADFNSKGIPDAENGAIDLRAAVATMKDDKDPTWTAYEKIKEVVLPLSDADIKTLRAMVAVRSDGLPHIDAAMAKPKVDWGIQFNSPVINTLLPHLKEMRMLANVVAAHALLSHLDGNDAEALKDVSRVIYISRAADQQPVVVTHLVSTLCAGIAAQTVESIVPDLKIGPTAPAASPKQVQELIGVLLDDAPPTHGAQQAFFAERMSCVDTVRCAIAGKINPVNLQILDPTMPSFGPKSADRANADGLMAIQFYTAVRLAFDQTSDLPTFGSRCPTIPKELDANPKEHVLARRLIAAPDRWLARHYKAMAQRRVAAVALAARAYSAAHDNAAPRTLDALVPEFLPRVPADPMTAAQPLKYAADLSLVYSVGEDGADNSGDKKSDVAVALTRPRKQ